MSNAAIDWVRDHGGPRCGSNADVAVLLLLADRANNHGITWVTHEVLLESLPTSRRQTVSEACRRLLDAEVVDAFTINRGARTRQILRVGAGALGLVPSSVSLPEWCRFTDLPTGWTSSTVERTGDAQESSTVESAGTSTVEREQTGPETAHLQHAQAYTSSTVERESPARLSVPNPKENPQGTLNNMADKSAVKSVVQVDGHTLPMPTRSSDDLTSRILEWATAEGLTEGKLPRDPAGRADVALQTIGIVVGDGPDATKSAQQVCVELVQHVTGELAPGPLWGHLGRLVKLEDPQEVAKALTTALRNGAGLTAEHAIDPLALTKYAKAVLNGSRSAA